MYEERLAIAHAAGQSTGAIGLVPQTAIVVDGHVMHLRAGQARPLYPIADGDRLARRDADDRLGEQSIEPRVPLAVTAEAGRHALGDHGEDAAKGVATLARGIDGAHHRFASGLVRTANC